MATKGTGTVSVTHIRRRSGNTRQSRVKRELAGYDDFVRRQQMEALQEQMPADESPAASDTPTQEKETTT